MTAEVVFFSNVRLSFPSLIEPSSSVPGGALKYSASFIMEKDNPSIKKFMEEVAKEATDKWKEHAQQVLQNVQQDRRLRCYGNGEEFVNQKTFQIYDGYEGKFIISANNDSMPQIVKSDGSIADSNNSMKTQQLTRNLYAGCYVNVAVRPWLQDNTHGRAVRCQLIAIQFAKDGEAFGEGKVDVSGLFGKTESTDTQPTTATDSPLPFNV